MHMPGYQTDCQKYLVSGFHMHCNQFSHNSSMRTISRNDLWEGTLVYDKLLMGLHTNFKSCHQSVNCGPRHIDSLKLFGHHWVLCKTQWGPRFVFHGARHTHFWICLRLKKAGRLCGVYSQTWSKDHLYITIPCL